MSTQSHIEHLETLKREWWISDEQRNALGWAIAMLSDRENEELTEDLLGKEIELLQLELERETRRQHVTET